jgi:HD-GYP domain-containing protein (c-di-GMP phosphodiesterase class II)
MLKKIPISKVRVGMYLHSLEGSWLSHSLWKTRFLIEAESELQKLRDSGAAEVWIDESRGMDAHGNATMQVRMLPAAALEPAPQPRASSMADEMQNAREIRNRAKVVVTSMFQQARMGNSFDAEVCAPLVADVVDSVHRNSDALVSLTRLKLADEYTYLHSVTVCALMVSLGKQLGFDRQECHEAGMAGLMHDLGKAAMPLEIINKPGSLTDSEFEIIRLHPARGHEMLLRAGVTNEGVLSVCRHHHERMDGKGYPDKLPSGRISQLVRMSSVCDVYDAITSNRPYKAGWDPAESISRMASWKGHFDEDVLRAFIKSLGIYPTGSLVRLQSGRLAVVIGQNPDKLTAPKVKVFFSTNTYTQLKPEVVDLHAPSCSERIIGREPPEKWSFTNLDKLWLERPA